LPWGPSDELQNKADFYCFAADHIDFDGNNICGELSINPIGYGTR
jgi:hypothetical protein